MAKKPNGNKQRVMDVEELKKFWAQKEAMERGEEPPTVEKAHVIRIDTPPVGTVPTDQTPANKTLTDGEGKSLSISDVLAQHDINPIDELLRMYNERVEDPNSPDNGKFVMAPPERRALMKELLKYTHPQLKAVEHKGNAGGNQIVVVLKMPDGSVQHKEFEQRGKVVDVPA